MRNGNSSGTMLTTTPSYDVLINWFKGTTMKNTSTLNKQGFPVAFTTTNYSCNAIIKGDSGDTTVGGNIIIFNSTEPGAIVMRYVNNGGSVLVQTYKAIAIGY